MQNLSVFQRLCLIIGIISAVFVVIAGAQILTLRTTVIEERQAKVRELVEAAGKILATFDERAKTGKISAEEARRLAFDAIGAMRWGQSADYFGVYGAGSANAGVTYVHANPKYIGVNRWDYADSQGRRLIQDIVGAARAGGRYVEYLVPRASGGPELPKLAYVGAYGEGERLLAVQAGVYVDDIDATAVHHMIWTAAGGLAGLLVAGLIAFGVGRGLTRPLARICKTMDELASGDLAVAVPFLEHRNEIGRIARSLGIFKDRLVQAAQARAEQDGQKERAASEQKAALYRIAEDFETRIGGIVGAVAAASTELQTTAQSMSATAEETSRQASAVAAASEEASTNVQTVASASEELSSSISEITRQVNESNRIAGEATEQASRTNAQIKGLAEAAQRIGDVVKMITDIAGQTNLLALNATIEAARAGESGKGFAVVASEVKGLASQTAKATQEISAKIAEMQAATAQSVTSVQGIGETIVRIHEIATTISVAMEQQGAATSEIARNVQQASAGTNEVSSNITGVTKAAADTGAAANQVLGASGELSKQSGTLREQVDDFLAKIRAA